MCFQCVRKTFAANHRFLHFSTSDPRTVDVKEWGDRGVLRHHVRFYTMRAQPFGVQTQVTVQTSSLPGLAAELKWNDGHGLGSVRIGNGPHVHMFQLIQGRTVGSQGTHAAFEYNAQYYVWQLCSTDSVAGKSYMLTQRGSTEIFASFYERWRELDPEGKPSPGLYEYDAIYVNFPLLLTSLVSLCIIRHIDQNNMFPAQ